MNKTRKEQVNCKPLVYLEGTQGNRRTLFFKHAISDKWKGFTTVLKHEGKQG